MKPRVEITIRPLYSVQECEHFQAVQRQVWGSEGEVDVVPVHVLVTHAKNGGMLLGAFAPDGPTQTGGMVGLAFGWPAFVHVGGQPTLKFCSHMLGVLPRWHSQGIGVRLKLAQRERLLAEGLTDWMTWTYDPLQRVNAVLNIHRLGATCTTYIVDAYGTMDDEFNAAMPSDRFQVDWQMASDRVAYALAADQQPVDWAAHSLQILPTRPLHFGSSLRQPVEAQIVVDERPLAVPLPDGVASLRVEPGLLMAWRLYLRQVMQQSFAAGYQVVDCVALPDSGWHYLLVQRQRGRVFSPPWA